MSKPVSISQKEYLKKYLGKDPSSKKRKKRKLVESKNVRIIDDDLNDNEVNLIEDDPFGANEDAPQIVAVIDERPPSMRIDESTKDNLWKPIGPVNEALSTEKLTVNKFKLNKPAVANILNHYTRPQKSSIKNSKDRSQPPPRKYVSKNDSDNDVSPPRRKHLSEDDNSPPRKSKNKHASESSPQKRRVSTSSSDQASPRKGKRQDSDASPERGPKPTPDSSPPRRIRRDSASSDQSPPRRRKISDKHIQKHKISPDISPPRRKQKSSCSYDQSPPRQTKKQDENLSPERNKKLYIPSSSQNKRERQSSSDQSPPRRSRKDDIPSSPNRKVQVSPDSSPPRRKQRALSPDQSLTRKRRRYSLDNSPPRINEPAKMEKTLDGKCAGLQKASELAKELEQFKKREDDLFSKLSSEASGKNAESIVRDRKTGKIRDMQEEAKQKQHKQEEENKRKEKYSRWGKGLKQVEEGERRVAETLHEMSKPLARYADDQDLESYLKEKECEGDPMLMYLRQKKKKKAKEQPDYAEKPEYMGEFMPNRYGIRPGHRWDGRDRSNGYEQKFFQVQNEKKALREETYKWSTEDM